VYRLPTSLPDRGNLLLGPGPARPKERDKELLVPASHKVSQVINETPEIIETAEAGYDSLKDSPRAAIPAATSVPKPVDPALSQSALEHFRFTREDTEFQPPQKADKKGGEGRLSIPHQGP
jgi:hypothetical protein